MPDNLQTQARSLVPALFHCGGLPPRCYHLQDLQPDGTARTAYGFPHSCGISGHQRRRPVLRSGCCGRNNHGRQYTVPAGPRTTETQQCAMSIICRPGKQPSADSFQSLHPPVKYIIHCNNKHTHTTVLLLVWNMSGSTRVSRYQKGKSK